MNNQQTLDNFFKCSSNNELNNLKKYFYLDWSDENNIPNNNAIILEKRPLKINFIEKIDCSFIKNGFYFYICGNFKNYDSTDYIIEKEKKYKNSYYLTSLLQKSVRKQNKNLTIQSCFHLMKLNLNDLLRRLPIIMLEDTYLHKSISTVIWLMIALGTKKFKMKKNIYEWILGFSYICCVTKKKDSFIKENKNEHENNNNNCNIKKYIYEILNNSHKLDNSSSSILYSLYFRIAYGGKKHDMEMIQSYITLWNNRFHNDSPKKINTMTLKTISIYVKPLEIEDWDLSAFDYHTNTNFTDFIFKKFPELTKKEIETLVWNFSSSINNRKINKNNNDNNNDNNNNNVEQKTKWLKIKLYVEKIQKYLLETEIDN
jgi:hypothetical protein